MYDPILCGLAANPELPAELVDLLIANADDVLAAELAERERLSSAQISALADRDQQSAVRLVQRGLLAVDRIDPITQPVAALAALEQGVERPEWARLLMTAPAPEHREQLAACPDLPPDVVDHLADDPDISVVIELALWTPDPSVTAGLAGHAHADVRAGVAANEHTPPAVLAALLTGDEAEAATRCLVCDEDPRAMPWPDACTGAHEAAVHTMYERALRNPATPVGLLARFADHPSFILRDALATREDLPQAVYERLARSPEPGVRAALAANPAISADLMRVLACDADLAVRRGLAVNPHIPLDLLTTLAETPKIGPAVLPAIAAASPEQVEVLARSTAATVRMLIAARDDLPAGIRDLLAADPDAKVLKSIATHSGLSAAQLSAMVDRHGPRVAVRLARNPETPPALLERISRLRPPVPKALREIAKQPQAGVPALVACLADPRARPVAAGHPALPPEMIVALLDDDQPGVVENAAANPSLPVPVMIDLVRSR
ncbi:hypothetical protein [Nonomuraea zeae]|uniref:Leucine rich repeat variant n=1 Tax=Nonomuraea zeae TaxID=1642303 RepID=A0A5S4FQ02_9ACTN|nr:hypothetical protein [Nonomuraea zeae]TMR22504.1 hypothetical protein ETD85_49385 [Nonomuraea zeae]